jgi:hypothetical protein
VESRIVLLVLVRIRQLLGCQRFVGRGVFHRLREELRVPPIDIVRSGSKKEDKAREYF